MHSIIYFKCFVCINSFNFQGNPIKVGNILNPILQLKKLRQRKVK